MGIRQGLREMGIWPKKAEDRDTLSLAALREISAQNVEIGKLRVSVQNALDEAKKVIVVPSPVDLTAGTEMVPSDWKPSRKQGRIKGTNAQPAAVSFANRSAGQKRRHAKIRAVSAIKIGDVGKPTTKKNIVSTRDEPLEGATSVDGWYAATLALSGGRLHARADGAAPNRKYVFVHKPNCSRTRRAKMPNGGSRFTRFANTEDVNNTFAELLIWPTACPTSHNWYDTTPPAGWVVNLDQYNADVERLRN